MKYKICFLCVVSLLNGASIAVSQDWNRFRGASGSGSLGETEHPLRWDGETNLAWKTPMEGSGWSSPIVVGEYVFLTSATLPNQARPKGFQDGVQDPATRGSGGKVPSGAVKFAVSCFQLSDGKPLWSKVLEEKIPSYPTHPSNTYATESPTGDSDSLYVHFGAIGLVASLSLEGDVRWKKDVGTYPMNAGFGTGSSLATDQGLLFLQSDNQEESFLLALDTSTGDELWRASRDVGSAWSSPVLWQNETGLELIACGPGSVESYEPESGELVWRLENIDGSFSSSPTFDKDRIFFGNSGPGSRGPLIAMRSGAAGTLTLGREMPAAVAWYETGAGPGMASPVLAGDQLFLVGSMGILSCIKSTTGKQVYRERLPDSSTVVASLWSTADHVFVLDESGRTYVIKTGTDFNLVRTNKIDDLFWSTPAVSNGSLLLRGVENLYCIRDTAPDTAH